MGITEQLVANGIVVAGMHGAYQERKKVAIPPTTYHCPVIANRRLAMVFDHPGG
jgi:hypothetical protein